jgi:hypothetical protein
MDSWKRLGRRLRVLGVCALLASLHAARLAHAGADAFGDCDEIPGGCPQGACEAAFDVCTDELAACRSRSGEFPATGQTRAELSGEDGNPAFGAPLAYTDLGLTVRDQNTGLEWEKKTTAPGSGQNAADLNDVDNVYVWVGACTVGGARCAIDADCAGSGVCDAVDSTIPGGATGDLTIFEWVAALNAANFAGHADWRVPNVKELLSIVDYGRTAPALPPVFGPVAGSYGSSTRTTVSDTTWFGVIFSDADFGSEGEIDRFAEFVAIPARAVRGGANSTGGRLIGAGRPLRTAIETADRSRGSPERRDRSEPGSGDGRSELGSSGLDELGVPRRVRNEASHDRG